MTHDTLTVAIEQLRSRAALNAEDPRVLFDDLQNLIDRLEQAQRPVPADLRQSAAELEGEIVDEFFDNLPV